MIPRATSRPGLSGILVLSLSLGIAVTADGASAGNSEAASQDDSSKDESKKASSKGDSKKPDEEKASKDQASPRKEGGAKETPADLNPPRSIPKKGSDDEEDPRAPSPNQPLRTDWVIAEFERLDSNDDGGITYLEARDKGRIDLETFRGMDMDVSGQVALLELEIYHVLDAEKRGLPIERSLRTRALTAVEEDIARREEEEAKKRPSYVLEKTLEALTSGSWDDDTRRRASVTAGKYRKLLPNGPRPRSPYHPRRRGF